MTPQAFPPGWDEARVKKLLAAHEALTEDEQVAEDEAAHDEGRHTVLVVPAELLPAIRQLLASHKSA